MNFELFSEASSFFKKNQFEIFDKEKWKYTNINQFKKFDSANDIQNNNEYKESSTNNIYLKNCEINSNIDSSKLSLYNLKKSIDKNLFNCKNIINSILPYKKDPYLAINTTHFNNGILIHIKDNQNIQNPINILNDFNEENENILLNQRVLIIVGKNSKVKFFNNESYENNININSVWEIHISENSNVDFINFSNKKNATQILNLGASIEKNSSFHLSTVEVSGKLIKNNFFINLNNDNSQCFLNGLNHLKNNDYIDNFVEIKHNHKNTLSDTAFYNLLNDKATSIFYAKAVIKKFANNSEAYQSNKNMLLSQKANIHSNPQLEIYNDDVKCTHSSTTGEIDKDALHYLRSRGISYKDAYKLIINGFINDIVDRINNDTLNEYLKNNGLK